MVFAGIILLPGAENPDCYRGRLRVALGKSQLNADIEVTFPVGDEVSVSYDLDCFVVGYDLEVVSVGVADSLSRFPVRHLSRHEPDQLAGVYGESRIG